MQCIDMVLPHGCWYKGASVRRVQVRPLTGEDERFLVDYGEHMRRAEQETAFLARLLRFPDSQTPLSPEAVRKLTAGDREALLLQLYRGLYGEHVALTLCCPACSEAMTLDLAVHGLLTPPAAQPAAEYPREVGGYKTVLRPVIGADLEALNGTASAGAEQLLRACVVSSEPPLPSAPLPQEQFEAFSEALAALDPQADVVLAARCPLCSHVFPVPFDAWDMLGQALARRRGRIDEEVHALAFYYHWTEEAILALPLHRRRKYLELIAGALTGEGL